MWPINFSLAQIWALFTISPLSYKQLHVTFHLGCKLKSITSNMNLSAFPSCRWAKYSKNQINQSFHLTIISWVTWISSLKYLGQSSKRTNRWSISSLKSEMLHNWTFFQHWHDFLSGIFHTLLHITGHNQNTSTQKLLSKNHHHVICTLHIWNMKKCCV